MTYFRRTGGQVVLFLLALAVLAISIYLTIVHYNTHVVLVCSSSGLVNCESVLSSKYAFVPNTSIPVSIPGILWAIVALILAGSAWFLWPQKRLLRIAEVAWSAFGILTVLYLVYAEIVMIHNICAWCTAVHILVLIYLLVSVVILQSASEDDEEWETE